MKPARLHAHTLASDGTDIRKGTMVEVVEQLLLNQVLTAVNTRLPTVRLELEAHHKLMISAASNPKAVDVEVNVTDAQRVAWILGIPQVVSHPSGE